MILRRSLGDYTGKGFRTSYGMNLAWQNIAVSAGKSISQKYFLF
jgi:hypothetical protein